MKTMDSDQNEDFEAKKFTDPNDPRTMECDEWARREADRMRAARPERSVELIRIEPCARWREAGASYIGSIWLAAGRYYHPNPPWAFHYAVLSEGIARDELYPQGLPFEAYRRIFAYWDQLEFTPGPG
jgi:hypothetical protein